MVYEEDTVVARKLVQIWFAHPIQLAMARRFVSGFALIVDGTFNTNSLRLPLLVAVGTTHTGETFPVFFSFCPGEDRISFDFCWESFKEECLRKEGQPLSPDPGVIIADWGQGLISSHTEAWPNTALQGCDWHAAEAILKWLREKRYDHVVLSGETVKINGKKVRVGGLKSQIWEWIKANSETDLAAKRNQLASQLKAEHQDYILSHWKSLESRFIHYYTVCLPNLGSTSSQKVESYHPVVREFTNAQQPLEKAVKALIKAVESWAKAVSTVELESLRHYPRLCQGADEGAFRLLRMTITILAARRLRKSGSR
jgi:hypothetical protein